MTKARGSMARLASQRLLRTPGEDPVPPAYGVNVALFRTFSEVSYAEQPAETVDRIQANVSVISLLQETIL